MIMIMALTEFTLLEQNAINWVVETTKHLFVILTASSGNQKSEIKVPAWSRSS